MTQKPTNNPESVGHVGWSPDYDGKRRVVKTEPGIGLIVCSSCGDEVLCVSGGAPRDWELTTDGYLCGVCR